MVTSMIRTYRETDLDVCAICGAFAPLDDTEQAVCYACLPDVSPASLQVIATTGQYHPDSVKGARVADLTATLSTLLDTYATLSARTYAYEHSPGHLTPGTARYLTSLVNRCDQLDQTIAALQADLLALAPLADSTPGPAHIEPHSAHTLAALPYSPTAIGRVYKVA